MTNHKNKRTHRRSLTAAIIILLVGIYVALCLLLPVRALSAPQSSTQLKITTQQSNLPWPKYGEGAVGLGDGTIVQSHGEQKPLPTASVAKLVTASIILKMHPLSVGQQGPMITIDSEDYNIYTKYVSEQGSVVPVYAGEQLSELQMLEAMLIPSGNNIADALARWAFGSLSAYDSYANNYVKQLGMNDTHIGSDASGFLPDTTSTANNLIILGGHVMNNPVLAQIVGMKSVNIPNVGVMTNYDSLIGTDGIVGIKTGNSNQAGGVFLGAAKTQVNSKTVTILVALMGAPNLNQALADTVPMTVSVENDFAQSVLVSKGEVLGEYQEPWGGLVQVVANSDLIVYVLQGQTAKASLSLSSLKIPSAAGQVVGSISTAPDKFNQAHSVQVVTKQSTTKPGWSWRLTHPQNIL